MSAMNSEIWCQIADIHTNLEGLTPVLAPFLARLAGNVRVGVFDRAPNCALVRDGFKMEALLLVIHFGNFWVAVVSINTG